MDHLSSLSEVKLLVVFFMMPYYLGEKNNKWQLHKCMASTIGYLCSFLVAGDSRRNGNGFVLQVRLVFLGFVLLQNSCHENESHI